MNYKDKREQMVYKIKEKYGLNSPDILSVMLKIPRHKFAPEKYKDLAYKDAPLPIGHGQTMSQPYTVAYMTDLLELTGDERVLEIGTGSGYQAAVLAELADEVYTMEIIKDLANRAKRTLKRLGYENVYVKSNSGEHGWKERAPFDAIIITAGIQDGVPEELFSQLAKRGVMVAPVGSHNSQIMKRFIKKENEDIDEEKLGKFQFVPFVEEEKSS